MKNSTLFVFSFFILQVFNFNAQTKNDIIFDVESMKFIDVPESLNEKDTGSIYLKHYNPFTHTQKITVNNINNNDKIFSFISGLASTYFGIKIPLEEPKTEGFTDADKNKVKSFIKLYNLHINLESFVRQNYLGCQKIKNLLNLIDGSNLIDAYYEIQNFASIHQIIEKKNITNEEIKNLELLKRNVKEYIDNNKYCLVKAAKYSAGGDVMSISITLSPKEEAIQFGFPLEEIIGKKNIVVRNKIKISFSGGIMGSLNTEPDYFVVNNNGDFSINEEIRDKFMPGVSALAHLNFLKNDTFSLIFGAGITIEKIPHFLSGASIKLFDSKLNLNLGYGWAYRKTLSDGFSLSEVYSESPTIKTKNILNGDFWFGLSYDLK